LIAGIKGNVCATRVHLVMDSYGTHKGHDTKPFVWGATADLTLALLR
jgi:hypothetical protein